MPEVHPVIHNPERLAAVRRFGRLGSPAEEAFDRLTRLAAKILDTPISLIALVGAERQFITSHVGLPEPLATRREMPLSDSIAKHVVAGGEALVVHDARNHPL